MNSTDPGQTFSVESTGDGLLSDQITALWVEEGQAVWVGTDQGLSRYDGHAWWVYTKTHGLASDWVTALSGDGTGGLWVGTSYGLNHFDGDNWRTLTTTSGLPENWITSLALDSQRGLWIGTKQGLAHLDSPESSPEIIDAGNQYLGSAEAVLPTGDGGAYLGVGNEVLYTSQEAVVRRYGTEAGLEGGLVQALAYTDKGELWAGTELGLYRFTEDAFVQIWTNGAEGEPDILSLAKDGKGGLWLGTDEGLWHFDGERVDERRTKAESEQSLSQVLVIQRAKDGDLWLGTDGGVNRWNPEVWRRFPAVESHIWSIAGHGEQVWATSDAGLFHWDGQDWESLTGAKTLGLWLDDDAVWFGDADGLQRLSSDGVIAPASEQFDDRQPYAIAGDDSGNLWVGTNRGLFLREGPQGKYHQVDELGNHFVRSLLVESDSVWVGSQNDGLSLRDDKPWRMVPNDRVFNIVRTLTRGADGSLWAGTADGLWRLPSGANPDEASAWLRYSSEDRLASDVVYAIWVDESDGQLWVGTEGGGLKGLDDNGTLDRGDDVWVALTTTDGLGDNQVTALWRDTQGVLWIGTSNGVLWHVPISQTQAPSVKSIWADNDILWTDSDSSSSDPQTKLDWQHNQVSFNFKGASLSTSRFFYRYQLVQGKRTAADEQSSSDNWQVMHKGQRINLERGNGYAITVQAFDTDLNTSQPVSATFAVDDAPFYFQLWFWLLVTGVLVLVGVPVGVRVYRWWRTRPRQYNDYLLTLSLAKAEQVCVTLVETARQAVSTQTLSLPRDKIEGLVSEVNEGQYNQFSLQDLGQRLSNVLFPTGLEAIQRPARIRLDCSASDELMAWPWELALDADGLGFLGQRADTALVRFTSGEAEDAKPLVSKQLRVLVVMAQSSDSRVLEQTTELNLAREKESLDETLGKMKQVELDYLLGVHAAELVGAETTARDLPNQLKARLSEGWDVVHFTGHAGYDLDDEESDEIVLWCEGRRGGYMPLGPDELATMLKGPASEKKAPKLVVLSACRTADIKSRLVQAILGSGVSAVIGMQWPVLDVAARAFAEGFYGTLTQHGQVDYAASLARNHIAGQVGLERRDWAAPVLVMQMPDGIIFERV